MKQLRLSKCAVALVDDLDFNVVGKYKWSLSGSGYACREYLDNGIMKRVYLHRFLLSCPNSHEVDHINGNPLDNRRCNLRLATHQENQCNQHKQKSNTSSRYKGVYFDRFNQKWRAQVTYKGITRALGRFRTEQEAALAYNKAAIKYHGQFARINEITEENEYE